MSYYQAKDCFNDNLQIGKPQDQGQQLMWNLSVGLLKLSEALESDVRQIQNQLDQIAQAL